MRSHRVLQYLSLLIVLTGLSACGSQPANYTYGNTPGAGSTGSTGSGTDSGTASSGTITAITFNNDVPVNLLESRSFKVILAQDIAVAGGTLSSTNFNVELNNNNYDQFFETLAQ